MSDYGKVVKEQVPIKEKIPIKELKNEQKNNFSFDERKKKEEFSSKYNESLMKNKEKEKIDELKNKYVAKAQKNYEDPENKYKIKEKKSENLGAGPRVFHEIKQINNEIDEIEKELEKTFKFYNNKLN